MKAFDPILTIIAADAKVKTCHVYHCWQAMREMGAKFHRAAFASFAGLEVRHVDAILAAMQAHGAMPEGKGRGATGKTLIAPDWMPPPVSDLSPQARSCAAQWTEASYATHAEAFRNYWHSQRKMMGDWKATWANRIVAIHSQVMRDQKFGNAPVSAPFTASAPVDKRASLERALKAAEMLGRDYEASDIRRQLSAMDNVIPFTRTDSLFESKAAV